MKKRNINRRAKLTRAFYIRLLFIFLILSLLGLIVNSTVWMLLSNYEKSTPEGNIREYLRLVDEKEYEKLYEDSTIGFEQFNTKEEYSKFLQDTYSKYNLNKLTLQKQTYSDSENLYYTINDNKTVVSTVQLKKIDKKYHIKTLTTIWNFNFDVAYNKTFSINNIKINDSHLTEKSVYSNAFNSMNDNTGTPLINRYHLDNFINIPQVDVENGIAVKDVIQDQFYIGDNPNSSESIEFKELLLDVATTYSKYITEDETFNNLSKFIDKKTSFYKDISEFKNKWFSNHDKVEFKNIEIFDIVKLSDNAFIGTVKYDYEVYLKEKIQNYPTKYQLFFFKENDKWLCTNLLIAD